MAENKRDSESGEIIRGQNSSIIPQQNSGTAGTMPQVQNLFSLGAISVDKFFEASAPLADITPSSLYVIDI
ncbi:MAG TPA: hypothetical protein VE732_01445, partial [Nitrososphaera sp.]|nr:hypothetical protein [Nitrososphaera sp.]